MPESGHTKQETKNKATDDEDSMEVDGNVKKATTKKVKMKKKKRMKRKFFASAI
jgi:hypothetical protein